MKLRMSITYPDGTVHKGRRNFLDWVNYLGLENYNFKNKNVLDIATDEGWWAFWAEMNGANYVEASDVELGEDYDWGYRKDIEWCGKLNSQRLGKKIFDMHHTNLNSKVVYKKQSIYEVEGNFDVVFCHGLLYHLRHPLLAIDRVRGVCNGVAIFETHVDLKQDQDSAQMKFYRTNEFLAISNWCGPTVACYTSWMKDAGFDHVYYSTRGFWNGRNDELRKFFVGVVDNEHKTLFDNNENFVHCDESYWRRVYNTTKYDDTEYSTKYN